MTYSRIILFFIVSGMLTSCGAKFKVYYDVHNQAIYTSDPTKYRIKTLEVCDNLSGKDLFIDTTYATPKTSFILNLDTIYYIRLTIINIETGRTSVPILIDPIFGTKADCIEGKLRGM